VAAVATADRNPSSTGPLLIVHVVAFPSTLNFSGDTVLRALGYGKEVRVTFAFVQHYT
jgi:hypothetical protein